MPSSYMESAFIERKKHLEIAQKALSNYDFDAIACRGVSGIVFGSALALMMDKSLIVARKPNENSHGNTWTETDCAENTLVKWIFVDDFIASGDTFRKTHLAISKSLPHAVLIGGYTYNCQIWRSAEKMNRLLVEQ